MSAFLLTGAGFTKNFGGLLAAEMWNLVFNHPGVQSCPSARERLLHDSDYESVYHTISTTATETERLIITDAVSAAYRELDERLAEYSFSQGSPFPVNIYKVQELIAAFAGPRGDPGFVFTLNQDLFLERHYYNGPRPIMPGVRQSPDWFSSVFCARDHVREPVAVCGPADLESIKTTFRKEQRLAYIKLHGSCNWRSEAGNEAMVVGRGKEDRIERHHVLRWYFELFGQCLSQQDCRLLVAGYGFADPHINRVLAERVVANGLSLYVLDPAGSTDLVDRIGRLPDGDALIAGVRAFYPYTLREMFPASQATTASWTKVQRELLDRRGS